MDVLERLFGLGLRRIGHSDPYMYRSGTFRRRGRLPWLEHSGLHREHSRSRRMVRLGFLFNRLRSRHTNSYVRQSRSSLRWCHLFPPQYTSL